MSPKNEQFSWQNGRLLRGAVLRAERAPSTVGAHWSFNCLRVGHLAAVVIVEPDVEQHVGAVLRRIDVLDHPVDRHVGIGHQFRAIAGGWRVVADRLSDAEQIGDRSKLIACCAWCE